MLNLKDLNSNNIYFLLFGTDEYIFRPNNNDGNFCGGTYIYCYKLYKTPNLFSISSSVKELRLATLKEKIHFLACEKADRFIPISEIKLNYEIYY